MIKNILLITGIMLLTLCSQLLLKKGLKIIGGFNEFRFSEVYEFIIKLIQNKFIILGVIIAGLAAFFWLIVISRTELTRAFPIGSGIFYIFLFLFSWIFLDETMTIGKILGMLIILAGIYLVALF